MNDPLTCNFTHGKSRKVLLQINNIQWMSAATFSILIRGHEAHLEDDDEGEDDGDDHDDELEQ